MAGDLTNRIALTQPLIVTSVNGPAATSIQGAQNSPNGADAPGAGVGPGAVRCAWLTNGATLNGFTLSGGGTRSSGDTITLQSGGGVWAASTSAMITGCIITNNCASYYGPCGGGGCYQGSLNRCQVLNNGWPTYGGGTYQTVLRNSVVAYNRSQYGGGVYYNSSGTLTGCTVVNNYALSFGGGTYNAAAQNCIIFNNTAMDAGGNWYSGAGMSYTCTSPLPSGTGNISADPQLLDGTHLKLTSPCRGAGSAAYASGTDLDGEAWASPPSMGCDEIWEAALTGPLSVGVISSWPAVVQGRTIALWGLISGRVSRLDWSFGDGSVQTNASTSLYHAWTNTGDHTVTFTAYNNDNPAGVSTNLVVHVIPLVAPTISPGALNGTNFTLSFFGQPGVYYYIDRATNLAPPVSWQSVSYVWGTNSPVPFSATRASNGGCFYRVRIQ